MLKRAMMMGTAPAKNENDPDSLSVRHPNLSARDAASTTNDTRTWRLNHEREILAESPTSFQFRISRAIRPTFSATRKQSERCAKNATRNSGADLDGAPPVVVGDLLAPNAKRTIAFMRTRRTTGRSSQWKSDPWKALMRDRDGRDVDWRNAKPIDPEWRLFAFGRR